MRKSKSEVDDDFSDFPIFNDDDEDLDDVYLQSHGFEGESDAAGRRLPARQRVELRNEQRNLRRLLSDWDDYDEDDLDTDL
ncbi:MAG TPA: hypothetical protein VF339_14240 [Gammaproteobacteria bacterium]